MKDNPPILPFENLSSEANISCAELLVETLLDFDPLLHVFCLTGGPIGPLVDAFGRRGVPMTFLAHEQSCAMASDGFARSTGQLAVTLVTNGPGVTNALTGVLGAYLDSVPMVVISGGVARKHRTISGKGPLPRQVGVQDVPTERIIGAAVKRYIYLDSPKKIVKEVMAACEIAFEPRPGPTWIEFPIDVQNHRLNKKEEILVTGREGKTKKQAAGLEETAAIQVVNLLKKAKRPLLIIGGGFQMNSSDSKFRKFIDLLGVPVIATWAAIDFFSWDDPSYIGNFGILGERAPNQLLDECDFLLVLGSRLSVPSTGYDSTTFAPNAFTVSVDIDEGELENHRNIIDLPVLEDLRTFIPQVIDIARRESLPSFQEWSNHCLAAKSDLDISEEEYVDEPGRIDAYRFSSALSRKLRDADYTICVDMGTACTAFVQSFRHNGVGKSVRAHGLSAMGYAIPAAIGVAKNLPNRKKLLAIAGDGAMQLNIQELQVISELSLPVKIFCLNSNGYRAIEIMQENMFANRRTGSGAASGVPNPDFISLAKAYGISTSNPRSINELEKLLNSNRFHNDQPLFVNVQIPESQRHRPRVVNRRDKDGKIVSPRLAEMWPIR